MDILRQNYKQETGFNPFEKQVSFYFDLFWPCTCMEIKAFLWLFMSDLNIATNFILWRFRLLKEYANSTKYNCKLQSKVLLYSIGMFQRYATKFFLRIAGIAPPAKTRSWRSHCKSLFSKFLIFTFNGVYHSPSNQNK